MTDRIIYLLISSGGGIDGRDHTDKGGQMRAASFSRLELERHPGKPWADIEPCVVDIETQRKVALAKLSPLDKLILELK